MRALLPYISLPLLTTAAPCPESPAWYHTNRFEIRDVRIAGAWGLLPAPSRLLPFGNRTFDIHSWQQAQHTLLQSLDALPRNARFAARLVIPEIRDCDHRARLLTVVYRLYSIDWPPTLSRAPVPTAVRRAVLARAPKLQAAAGAVPKPACLAAAAQGRALDYNNGEYALGLSLTSDTCSSAGFRASIEVFRPSLTTTYHRRGRIHEFDTRARFASGRVSFEPRLHSVAPDGSVTAQLTAAITVWRVPMVPDSITRDPAFTQALDLAFSASESSLAAQYLSETPTYAAVLQSLEAIRVLLRNIPPPEDATLRARLTQTLSKFKGRQTSPTTARALLCDLAVGGPDDPPVPSLLTTLATAFRRAQMPQPGLERLHAAARALFEAAEASPDAARAAARAGHESAATRALVERLTRQTNLFAISPVILAAAGRRVDPRAGAGVRLSALIFEITAGYAFHLRPRPAEPPGKLFFTAEINNFFR